MCDVWHEVSRDQIFVVCKEVRFFIEHSSSRATYKLVVRLYLTKIARLHMRMNHMYREISRDQSSVVCEDVRFCNTGLLSDLRLKC